MYVHFFCLVDILKAIIIYFNYWHNMYVNYMHVVKLSLLNYTVGTTHSYFTLYASQSQQVVREKVCGTELTGPWSEFSKMLT